MLPAPDPLVSPLLVKLRDRIRREGPMPIDRYMLACLADPEHGYWARQGTIGADGDFITAPEISQVFGELIGLWCAVVWHTIGQPAPVRLAELGPGRGTLMRDALRAARIVPHLLDAATIHLIEISAPLREMQRGVLPAAVHKGEGSALAVGWHEALADVPPGPAIVIANEFLDALPIRQLAFAEGVWHERIVDLDEQGALRFVVGGRVDHAGLELPHPGAIAELREGEEVVLAQLAARREPFVALIIDYGPAQATFGDTLQAVRRHAYVDPLADPGGADLTAHVQFAGLARKAQAVGLAADGPMTQAEFLGALGIAERAARLMASNPALAGEIEAGVQRLMSPTGMGGLFKVMAIRTPHLPALPPFG